MLHLFILSFFLLNFFGWHRLTKWYRFQVHNSTTHHLHTVLCVHHPSSLLPSPLTPPAHSSASALPLPPAITTLLSMRLSFFCVFSISPPLDHRQLSACSLWVCLSDPTSPLLGVYPKKPETPTQQNICTPVFTAALVTIANMWKQPKCPSADEWMKQLWDSHTMEYYSSIQKKEIVPFATAWMDLESMVLSEI